MSAYVSAVEIILTQELETLQQKRRMLRVKLSSLEDVSSKVDEVSDKEKELFNLAVKKLELEAAHLDAEILAAEVAKSVTQRYMLEQANAFSDYAC